MKKYFLFTAIAAIVMLSYSSVKAQPHNALTTVAVQVIPTPAVEEANSEFVVPFNNWTFSGIFLRVHGVGGINSWTIGDKYYAVYWVDGVLPAAIVFSSTGEWLGYMGWQDFYWIWNLIVNKKSSN